MPEGGARKFYVIDSQVECNALIGYEYLYKEVSLSAKDRPLVSCYDENNHYLFTVKNPSELDGGILILSDSVDRWCPHPPSGSFLCTPQIWTFGPIVVRPDNDDDTGLKVKYEVRKKRDGELIDGCFVLRPDKDKAARMALRAYASATDNLKLARDIMNWLDDLETEGKLFFGGTSREGILVTGEKAIIEPGTMLIFTAEDKLVEVDIETAEFKSGKSWRKFKE